MRRVGILLMLVGVLFPGQMAQAATAPIPHTLSTKGWYGTSEVTAPIPAGTEPVRFTGRIESNYTSAGKFVLSVNDRIRKRVPIRGGRFVLPLRARDVRNQTVTITLGVELRPSRNCLRDDQSTAVIRRPRLVLDRRPPVPGTIATFLSRATDRFVVAVPARPSTEEQAAGLDAVLALRHAFGPSPAIRLRTTDDPPRTSATRHVLVVDEDGSGSSALSIRAGRLHVTGSPTEIGRAAISLADPNIGLLKTRSITNLAGTADYQPAPPTTTLEGLGLPAVKLRGIGTLSQTVAIPQAAFGQPVSQLEMNLRGVVTPVSRGAQGRVSVRWNDQLVTSQVLSDSSQVSLDFTVPAGNLVAVNSLQADFEYIPGGRNCRQALPGEFQIDPVTSTVTASFGDSTPPGFQRFPQSFPARIPVSFGLKAGPALRNAARILDSAASVSPLQYTVEILDKPSRRPGALVTGVTGTQAQNLGAPLPNQQNLADFAAGRSTQYAALQAFHRGGDDVIVLSAEPDAAARALSQWPSARDGGWAGLEGQVYVKARDSGTPQAFDAPASTPSMQRPLIIAVVVLTVALLLGLLVWWRFRRRDKR
jgi:hypothetical protein